MQPNLYEKILEIMCPPGMQAELTRDYDIFPIVDRLETHMVLIRTAFTVFFETVSNHVLNRQQFDDLHEILMDIENELADEHRPWR
jgi:hypothetical protein